MHKQIETGWPAIGILAVLFGSIFAVWLGISGDSPERFTRIAGGLSGALAVCF
jgi:hypothetical protein